MTVIRRTVKVCCLAGAGALLGLAVPDLRARRRLCQVTQQLGRQCGVPAEGKPTPAG